MDFYAQFCEQLLTSASFPNNDPNKGIFYTAEDFVLQVVVEDYLEQLCPLTDEDAYEECCCRVLTEIFKER
jgi:hypothetical protein